MSFDAAAAEADLLRATGIGGDHGARTRPDEDAGPALGGVPLSVVGIGWATVELDRAATELGSTAGYDVEPAEPDALLGATARIGRAAGSGPVAVLLEPFTEGRLAAFLARHGEAPAVLYVVPPAGGLEAAVARLTAARIRTRSGSGPLGPAALVLGRSADEPQLILVAVPSEP
ncbi:MAG: hypothetical protein ABI628_09185 [Chloroflexota bacterium]